MASVDEPVRALRRLLRSDPGFGAEPRRLSRGLLDLLPHDDRAVRLLTVAAEVGVPALVSGGSPGEARRVLIDRAGLSPEAAAWTVRVWHAAGTDEPITTWGTVRIAAWPDGALLVVTRDARGVFGAIVETSGPGPWRLIAPSTGPGAVGVSADGDRVVVAWVGPGGVYAATVPRRTAPEPPDLVAEPRAGLTPETPLVILAVDETLTHLVWPVGDGRLRRGSWRSWPSDDADEDLTPGGAEVTGLDVARLSPGAAVLMVSTGDRLLVADWDVAREHIGLWRERPAPADAISWALAGDRLFAGTTGGTIVDGAGLVVRRADEERLVAAAAAGGTTWLVTVTADTMNLSRPDSGVTWSLPAP